MTAGRDDRAGWRRPAGPVASALRLFAGAPLIAAGLGNALFFLPRAEPYPQPILELAYFSWCRHAVEAIVMPRPELSAGALCVHEVDAGLLGLNRRRTVDAAWSRPPRSCSPSSRSAAGSSLTNLDSALVPLAMLLRHYHRSPTDTLVRRGK